MGKNDRLEILANRVPVVDTAPDNVLDNHWFRLEVDPESGGIVSFIDKKNGHEWVNSKSGEPFGGYRYDLYSITDIAEFLRAYGLYFQDWFVHDFGKQRYPEHSRHVTAYARNFKLEKVRGEYDSTIRLTGGRLRAEGDAWTDIPDQEISLDISGGSLHNQSYIELAYHVKGKGATPLAESTVVPVPLNLRKPIYRMSQTGSVIDPARDIVEGANRELMVRRLGIYNRRQVGF